jgi:hypothetical protein
MFFPRRKSVKCCPMSSLNPKRSPKSRTRIEPPSEVTRDPWKSTFKELWKESWNGWFCFSHSGCEPPGRLRRVQTHMNRAVRDQQRFSSRDSNPGSIPSGLSQHKPPQLSSAVAYAPVCLKARVTGMEPSQVARDQRRRFAYGRTEH